MRVCIFCGSRSGVRPAYAQAARDLAALLVERGVCIVYGGGSVGLMGTIADRMIELGGEVIGVIPQALATREVAHGRLTELRVVDSMHTRKALMAELADGFIALPGGYGTLEEFCEVVTWVQLGIHRKPCGLLNVGGYFDPLIAMFDRAVDEGFVSAENRRLVMQSGEPHSLLDQLQALGSSEY